MTTHDLSDTEQMLVSIAHVELVSKVTAANAEFSARAQPIVVARGWKTANFVAGLNGRFVAVVADEPSTAAPDEQKAEGA